MRSPIRPLVAAARSLLRRPRTTAYTLVLLTVGVGLSTAMFSVLDGVVLRGLPFEDGRRIVQVTTQGELPSVLTPGDFEALSAAVDEPGSPLEELAGALALNTVVTRPGLGSKGMTGTYVTTDLLPMLGVEPVLGRSFVPEDAEPGEESVVIISHRLWRRWFGGAPEALGETVIVNRQPMRIVGVMPEGFRFPVRQDAWTPLRREGFWARVPVFGVGRLAPGVRPEEAESALAPVATRLDAEDPLPRRSGGPDTARRIGVTPYVETLVPPEIDRSLRLMLWAVLGVLLIACGNAAGLRLGDTLARRRELAVRRALGARAGQLLRPLLAETTLLAGAAAAAGTGLAWLLVRLGSEAMLRGSMLERLFWVDLRLDARACLFATGAAALAALLGTLPPALWSLSRRSLRLDAAGGTSAGPTGGTGGLRLAGLLVVAQVAVCFGLVSASALLVESGRSVLDREPGFDPDGLLRVMVNPYQAEWETPEEPRSFWARLIPRLEADPGIAGATLASGVPWGSERGVLNVAVRSGERLRDAASAPVDLPEARLLRVLPGFFEAVRLPLLAGRGLEARDVEPAVADRAGDGGGDEDGHREIPVVVSAGFAARYLTPEGGSGPLGAPVELVRLSGDRPTLRGRVVGVAADRAPGRSDPAVYTPLDVGRGGGGFLIVRGLDAASEGDAAAGGPDLRRRVERAVAGVDPLVATQEAATYREDVAETVWVERRLAQLFTLFAGASLVLSGFGLFGAAVLTLRRRSRELAIRSALGALPAQLRAFVLRQGLRWIGLGLAGGAGLAWITHRLLRGVLHGVGPWDPALTVGAAALTVLALSAAVLGPARRAARTDPAAVLDGES